MAGNLLARTGSLSKFLIRLNRVRIFLWLAGLTFFTLIVPASFVGLYSSQAEREGMAETMENPAMTAMVGPGNLENYTVGAMTTHQMLLMTAAVAGLMSILLLTRHTRADEEDGRVEMIRALPTGRLSYLNAVVIMVSITSLALALITGFGLYALGIESMGLEGSLLFGAALGGTALVFAGVAAVFAQLSDTSRGTLGLSVAVLLLAYLFRAVTDVSNPDLSWISPLGWVTKTDAYSSNNWWPLLLMTGFSACLFVLANYLQSIRDLERGFLPSRSGKNRASFMLQSPFGLTLRLQRKSIVFWGIGLFVMGASYGSVLGDMNAFFEGNQMMQQMLQPKEGLSLIEQFIPMLIIVISIIATIPVVMSMTKLRGEEKKERIDHLLGRAVSRFRLMGDYLLLAMLNGFLMLSLAAFGLWSAGTASMEEEFSFSMVYGAAVSYYPALMVMIGITVFLIGFLPKLTSLIWLYLLYSFIVVYLGNLMQFPEWMNNLSPYGHIPETPVEKMTWLPIVLLSMVAIVLITLGFTGFRRRDITS